MWLQPELLITCSYVVGARFFRVCIMLVVQCQHRGTRGICTPSLLACMQRWIPVPPLDKVDGLANKKNSNLATSENDTNFQFPKTFTNDQGCSQNFLLASRTSEPPFNKSWISPHNWRIKECGQGSPSAKA